MPRTATKASTTPTAQQQGLVVFAKNKKRVSAFYAQVLQLEVMESASTHDLLRGGSYEVVVHAIPRRIASTITLTRPPTPREDTPFKPSFIVPSLDAARKTAQATALSESWPQKS